MIASKENCEKAITLLMSQQPFMNEQTYQHIAEFLRAALKRLPTEAALKRDMERTRKARKPKKKSEA